MILVAVLHNMFAKELRTISLNTHRIVLTKSLRDSSQISFLSRQCYPHVKNFLPAVYQHCIKLQDFPYLVLNFSPGKESENYIKVTTKIFPHEHPMVVFRENECRRSSATNPYEKLILINQNLYDILKRGEGIADCNNSDYTEDSRDLKNSSPTSSVQSNNNNNIEIVGFDQKKNGNPPLRSEEPQSSAYDKKDTHIHTGKSSTTTNNVGRVEDKSESSVPFMLPSMNEVFKKRQHDTQDMETEQYHHGDQIKRSENLDQDVVGRQLNNMTHKKNSMASQEKLKLKRLRNSRKNIKNRQEKYENLSTGGKKTISQNSAKTIESTSTAKKTVKRKGYPKINRSIHPFKIRKVEIKEKPLIRKFKTADKRKAPVVLNREIHPFKATKTNRGDKRKNADMRFEISKRMKEKHSRLNSSPSQYQKWNF